jgi:hypothetical protein
MMINASVSIAATCRQQALARNERGRRQGRGHSQIGNIRTVKQRCAGSPTWAAHDPALPSDLNGTDLNGFATQGKPLFVEMCAWSARRRRR